MTFNKKYSKIEALINDELKQIEQNILSSIAVPEPLQKSIVQFLTSPSKHIRSTLGILFTKAITNKFTNDQIELLSAIELIHNASLIHDDIIDESEIRRGNPTLSVQFGNKLGVISGDYLLSIAMQKISKFKNPYFHEKLAYTLEQMTKGEIFQHFNKYKIGTLDDYIEKSKNKTAYLFENAVTFPQILLKKRETQSAHLFGTYFGIAFQIRDDLQNVLEKENLKPANNDIEQGIYTAPVIFSGEIDNLQIGIEKTQDLINNYINKAKEQIKGFKNNPYTEALNELLELFKYE